MVVLGWTWTGAEIRGQHYVCCVFVCVCCGKRLIYPKILCFWRVKVLFDPSKRPPKWPNSWFACQKQVPPSFGGCSKVPFLDPPWPNLPIPHLFWKKKFIPREPSPKQKKHPPIFALYHIYKNMIWCRNRGVFFIRRNSALGCLAKVPWSGGDRYFRIWVIQKRHFWASPTPGGHYFAQLNQRLTHFLGHFRGKKVHFTHICV